MLFNKGYLLSLHASNGTVISGRNWTGGDDGATHHLSMKSLLINSWGDEAFALVYGLGQQLLLRTNPSVFTPATQ